MAEILSIHKLFLFFSFESSYDIFMSAFIFLLQETSFDDFKLIFEINRNKNIQSLKKTHRCIVHLFAI